MIGIVVLRPVEFIYTGLRPTGIALTLAFDLLLLSVGRIEILIIGVEPGPLSTTIGDIITDIGIGLPITKLLITGFRPVDIPALLVILPHGILDIVSEILGDIIMVEIEHVHDTDTVSRANLTQQGILDAILGSKVFEDILILHAKVPQLLGLHMEDATDLAGMNPQGVQHITTGSGNG